MKTLYTLLSFFFLMLSSASAGICYIKVESDDIVPFDKEEDGSIETPNAEFNELMAKYEITKYFQSFPTIDHEWLIDVYTMEGNMDIIEELQTKFKDKISLIEEFFPEVGLTGSGSISSIFAPVGAKWSYAFNDGQAPTYIKGTCTLEVMKEVELNGKLVRAIDVTTIAPKGMSATSASEPERWDTTKVVDALYVYNDADTAYVSRDNGKTFKRLFVFNASVGDELYLDDVQGYVYPDGYTFKVDSVVTTENGLKMYRGEAFYKGEGYGMKFWFMDKVGGVTNYLWPTFGMTASDSYRGLRSLTYNGVTFTMDEGELAQLSSTLSSSVVLFPNPVVNTLSVATDKAVESILIYDVKGNIMLSGKAKELDCSTLNKGIYFVKVRLADGENILGKIIKE